MPFQFAKNFAYGAQSNAEKLNRVILLQKIRFSAQIIVNLERLVLVPCYFDDTLCVGVYI
jgi:hypothetical protein